MAMMYHTFIGCPLFIQITRKSATNIDIRKAPMSENVGSRACHLLVHPATCTAICSQILQRWRSNFNREHSVVFEVTQYIQLIRSTHILYYGKRYEL
jgi:hypothetical protein